MKTYYVIEDLSGKDVSGPMSSKQAAQDYCDRREMQTGRSHSVEW